MIYPEQQADYLSKTWNSSEFDTQFDLLMDEEAFIATTDQGFVHLSLVEKIMQVVKRFLGGTDHSQDQRVQAAWLKFLYYGEAHELIKEEHIERLQRRITYSSTPLDPNIEKLFKEIQNQHQSFVESSDDHLSNLRNIITDYHQQHASLLRPGFWNRIMNPPFLNINTLNFFGDTPLQLSTMELEKQVPNAPLALNYLIQAFKIKNEIPEFQEKLAEQLKELEDSYPFALEGQKRKIQELWIELGQIAFKNELPNLAEKHLSHALEIDTKNIKARLKVGKLYLLNQEYVLAKPFLEDLKKSFPQDIQVQTEVGHAYWQNDEFEKAIDAYEAVVKLYEKNAEKFTSHHKQIAAVYHRLGVVHLKKFIPSGHLTQSFPYFTAAIQTDPTILEFQESLCEAYYQQWLVSNGNFVAPHGQIFLKALNLLHASVIKKNQATILLILLGCSEELFKAKQSQKADVYLEKAFTLFPEDADVKIQVLNLAIQYDSWASLVYHFNNWEHKHFNHPYLKTTIADAYWTSSDKKHAIKIYEESLELFEQRLPLCQTDAERTLCQQAMADIQARIGQSHLTQKTSLFKGTPFATAIANLEKAAALNSKLYSTLLFDTYLAAAQSEKQRNKLVRDTNKIIEHYQKAFQHSHQKGDYLIELLQLYFDKKRGDEAVALYLEIQHQPWAKELELPATILNQLAKKLAERKDYENALICFKEAYRLDTKHQKHKFDYFQFSLHFAKEMYTNIQKREIEEDKFYIKQLTDIANNLETCYAEGFEHVKKLKQPFQQQLTQVYEALAIHYVQRSLLPRPASEMDKEEIEQHKELHQEDIEQAFEYYDIALLHQPENAALHFDKGILLDWLERYEEAFREFRLAVQHQTQNPFYHKLLGPLHFVLYSDSEENQKHQQLAEQCASPNFKHDYLLWKSQFMSPANRNINPHSYTQQKKGLFS